MTEPLEATDRPSVNPEQNIAQPRKHKNGACSCGFVWSSPADIPVATVIGGNWGDEWPSIRTREDGTLEPYMESSYYGEVPREQQAANMKFLAAFGPDVALSLITEVQELSERITELEAENANFRRAHEDALALADKLRAQLLLHIHGDGDCHICGKPRVGEGSGICSYPHGRIPAKAVDSEHPEGFWTWEFPAALNKTRETS